MIAAILPVTTLTVKILAPLGTSTLLAGLSGESGQNAILCMDRFNGKHGVADAFCASKPML
ncbi:MAG: hypothetical protein K5768_01425 [Firmicutes bacterium]|nr:hypothetical protein [Bacillota bacterium]